MKIVFPIPEPQRSTLIMLGNTLREARMAHEENKQAKVPLKKYNTAIENLNHFISTLPRVP